MLDVFREEVRTPQASLVWGITVAQNTAGSGSSSHWACVGVACDSTMSTTPIVIVRRWGRRTRQMTLCAASNAEVQETTLVEEAAPVEDAAAADDQAHSSEERTTTQPGASNATVEERASVEEAEAAAEQADPSAGSRTWTDAVAFEEPAVEEAIAEERLFRLSRSLAGIVGGLSRLSLAEERFLPAPSPERVDEEPEPEQQSGPVRPPPLPPPPPPITPFRTQAALTDQEIIFMKTVRRLGFPDLCEGAEADQRGNFWHQGCGPTPGSSEAMHSTDVAVLKQPRYIQLDEQNDRWWLRIPNRNCVKPTRGDRHSTYGGLTTDEVIRGFHRAPLSNLWTAFTLLDWKNQNKEIYMPGILVDGFMRNGVNDSSHRGVWFHLHFNHPWPPSQNEIVVELFVTQSSIHRSCKSHMKYCAAQENPGARNEHVAIAAVHLPLRLLPWYSV